MINLLEEKMEKVIKIIVLAKRLIDVNVQHIQNQEY